MSSESTVNHEDVARHQKRCAAPPDPLWAEMDLGGPLAVIHGVLACPALRPVEASATKLKSRGVWLMWFVSTSTPSTRGRAHGTEPPPRASRFRKRTTLARSLR